MNAIYLFTPSLMNCFTHMVHYFLALLWRHYKYKCIYFMSTCLES